MVSDDTLEWSSSGTQPPVALGLHSGPSEAGRRARLVVDTTSCILYNVYYIILYFYIYF